MLLSLTAVFLSWMVQTTFLFLYLTCLNSDHLVLKIFSPFWLNFKPNIISILLFLLNHSSAAVESHLLENSKELPSRKWLRIIWLNGVWPNCLRQMNLLQSLLNCYRQVVKAQNIIRCGRRDLFSHLHLPAPRAGLSLILLLNAFITWSFAKLHMYT